MKQAISSCRPTITGLTSRIAIPTSVPGRPTLRGAAAATHGYRFVIPASQEPTSQKSRVPTLRDLWRWSVLRQSGLAVGGVAAVDSGAVRDQGPGEGLP